MKISDFRKFYGNDLSKIPKSKFKYKKNGDTLISIGNKDPFKEKGVSVKYEPKDSIFLETYKDIVYQKYSVPVTEQKTKNYMRLWRTPLKIYFAKSVDKDYKKAIIKTANKLSKGIDSLTISFVNDLEKSNYIIYQIDDENSYKYEKRMSKNKYIDYYLTWKNTKIYDAKLEINLLTYKNTSKATNINYINQVFFKTLGRFYDSSKMPNRSILSKRNSNRKSITKLDLEILKYHYSFGICKGTDLETFEDQHKRAKEELKKGNRFNFYHKF